jgi:hypothetical protein
VILINLATFQWNGDVGRWAAVSTIWIVMPMIVAGLIFFVLLAGMIYLLARLLGILPTYTGQAQDFAHMLALRVRHLADASVKPVISLSGLGASLRTLLGRK